MPLQNYIDSYVARFEMNGEYNYFFETSTAKTDWDFTPLKLQLEFSQGH